METHPNHIHHTPGKKFRHYFYEFLMLFVAVFCGFMAENIREHRVEIEREKVYMQSMVEDIIQDTIEINRVLAQIDSTLVPIQNISTDLLFSGDFSDSTIKKMYEYVPRSISFLRINFEDRTINQLKNSGNLRLIRSKNVTDSLAVYWKRCDIILDPILSGYAETRSNSKEMVFNLFNMNNYIKRAPTYGLIENKKLELLSKDKTKFIILGNYISNLQSQASAPLTNALKKTKSLATNIIKMINEKYRDD